MKRTGILLLTLLMCLSSLSSALADRTLRITFTGDVTLGSEENKKNREESFNSFVKREGYGYFFRKVKDLFEADDLTVVNLEGVLSDSARNENKKKTYRFRGPTEYVQILKEASIEACAISNNHTKDFGKQGYNSTRKTLKDAGIDYFGAEEYFIFEKDGIQIAFFALVSTIVQGHQTWGKEITAKLREEGVDAVVVCIHVGQEYDPHHNITQKRYAEMALSNFGADLVIMHHPHVLQGVEIMNNRTVCYSLGNFCFGGNAKVRALETMIVQAELDFTDDGTYKGQRLRFYPAYTCSSAAAVGDPNDYQPTLVTGDAGLAVMQLVQNDTDFELGLYDEEAGCLTLPYLPAEERETDTVTGGAGTDEEPLTLEVAKE